ncbi:hypothetical protein AB7044_12655 [Providencia stuartii]|uniref:hypothetical protein n=1 Tax=Providencia stuartii TaxID=588 RepID=UPI0034E573D3
MNKTLLGMVIIGVSATPVMAAEFTCQLGNKKYVSVIVDAGKTPQYRYGTLAKPEITLPLNEKGARNIFVGQGHFIAGESLYIRFQNGPYSYLLYQGEGRGWAFKGLAVYKNNKLINKKECQNWNSFDLYDILNYQIRTDPALELYDSPYSFDPNSNE